MILAPLSDAARFEVLGPRIAAALAWLRGFDPATPDGRYAVDGADVFALVSSYATGPATEKRFEAHRRHLDVQFVAAGAERLLHLPAAGLETETPYDEGADVLFFREPTVASSLLLRAGDCCLLWPGDAHKPGCMAGGRSEVKKVVVKVRL